MAEQKKKKKKKHRFFWFMIKLQIFLMLVVLAGLGYYYFGGYAEEVQQLKREAVELVANSDESIFVPSRTSSIYDTDGNLISERKGSKEADYVSYEDIPPEYITAIISIEDKKFYSHNGVDFKAVLRAAKAMLENGKITQGGSTITMQLAKLIYMEPGKTWQYKVKQMFIAMELEKRYSKDKLMEFYLNNIYFANGYYGIEAACHGYFDCELSELDISQIAFLCAIPNSPSYYDPIVHMENTITRRNLILKNMLDDGKIDQAAYEAAATEEIILNPPQDTSKLWNNYVDTYTYHCATKALMESQGFIFKYYFDSEEEEKAYDAEYDELYADCQQQLYGGGYKIYTSIDMEKQTALQESVDSTLAGFTETGEDGVYSMQGAAVCIDNATGFVVAIVGGRSQDFSGYTLNRAYQSHRQPGSCIKPLIVYTPCFENGYTPDSIVDDHPFEGGPSNAGDVYYGEVSIRFAVEKSLNTVAWQLYEELTPEVGLQYLKNMNFTNIVSGDYVPATSLGGFTTGVSAVEMASAYAALEHDGLYRQPTCIKSIIDSDENIVYASDQVETVIYKETAARMMTDVMVSVMQEGTGRSRQLDNMPCAGKTGTTNDKKDGWFVGYTRYYTTSVWVGYDYPKKVDDLEGASYPGEIWQIYMNRIHEDLTPISFLPYAQLSDGFQQQEPQDIQQPEEPQVTDEPEEPEALEQPGDGAEDEDAEVLDNPENENEPEAGEIPDGDNEE